MYHEYTTQLLDGVQGTAGANKKAQEKMEQHAQAVGDYDLILCKKQYLGGGGGGGGSGERARKKTHLTT